MQIDLRGGRSAVVVPTATVILNSTFAREWKVAANDSSE